MDKLDISVLTQTQLNTLNTIMQKHKLIRVISRLGNEMIFGLVKGKVVVAYKEGGAF